MRSFEVRHVIKLTNQFAGFRAPCVTHSQLEICRKIISKWKLNELEDQKSDVIRIIRIITAIIGKIVGADKWSS